MLAEIWSCTHSKFVQHKLCQIVLRSLLIGFFCFLFRLFLVSFLFVGLVVFLFLFVGPAGFLFLFEEIVLHPSVVMVVLAAL